MKITALKTFAVQPRWLFVKLETDEGICGWGECLGDKAPTVRAAVQSYEHAIIGEDPRNITHLWQLMYRAPFWRGGPILCAAMSGIEMACWDILGKSLGAPVWQLLGGKVRSRIRVYTRPSGSTPEELAASSLARFREGYTGVKLCPIGPMKAVELPSAVEDAVATVGAIRDAVGPKMDILLDFHGRVGPAMAIRLEDALRSFMPMWIEEPTLPENHAALAKCAAQFKTPIATGERLFTKWGFQAIVEGQCAAVLQPDPCVCGGIQEARAIGAMAETAFMGLAPHNPYGPINLAACLQIDAATPNFLIQEFIDGPGLGAGYLREPFVVKEGYIDVPTAPGLGIDVDEEALLQLELGPLPDVGRLFHADDGSMADW